MAKIAVIGTGISGLSAACLLHRRHDITVYEKNARPGGHSRTLTVRHGGRDIAVDTGFIVFNERNYPNLTALFRRLGVTIKNSDMSFGLTVDNGRLEWGAKSLDAIFGQRRNLLRPRFLKLLLRRACASICAGRSGGGARAGPDPGRAAHPYAAGRLVPAPLSCCRWRARSGAVRPARCWIFPPAPLCGFSSIIISCRSPASRNG